jgi:hypothetical protein
MLPLGVQVVLAKSAGGLLIVSADSSFAMPFPWTARAMAVSCIKSEQLAVLAESYGPDNSTEAWLHILAAPLAAHTPMSAISRPCCLADKHTACHTKCLHVHIGASLCSTLRTHWGKCITVYKLGHVYASVLLNIFQALTCPSFRLRTIASLCLITSPPVLNPLLNQTEWICTKTVSVVEHVHMHVHNVRTCIVRC